MRFMTMIHGLLLGGICLACLACAKQTPAPQDPSTVQQAPTSSDTTAASDADSASGSAHSLDVGMDFKDKDDSEYRRANHDTPPTSSWKPVGKDKSIDSKDSKSEPGKASATAAR